MILIIILATVVGVGAVIKIYCRKKRVDWISGWNQAGDVVLMFGIAFFTIAIIMIPIIRYDTKSGIIKYHALVETIEQAREGEADYIERAALTTEIAETNQWLATRQYWNATTWGGYILDEVMELELIK